MRERLGAVAGAELPDRRAEVVANRSLGEMQVRGDLGGRGVPHGGDEDVVLALGERADAVGDRGRREPGVDHAPPGVDLADGVGELDPRARP